MKCPVTKKNCLKNECALWVELVVVDKPGQDKQKQGKCSIAWLPILLVEFRETVERIAKQTMKS